MKKIVHLWLLIVSGVMLFSCEQSADDHDKQDHNNKSSHHTHDETNKPTGKHELHGHTHDPIELPKDAPLPTIDIRGHIDQSSGVNIEIITENFRFTPENVNTRHIDWEWHAHIYIDDVKIGRVYSNWVHLPQNLFMPGSHIVRVNLNSNEHSPFHVDGEEISNTVEVIIE